MMLTSGAMLRWPPTVRLMNLRSKSLSALAFVVSVALTSCGTATAPVSTAGLNGNWNLVGDRALSQYPLLSTTLTVNGNQITGEGYVDIRCQAGLGLGVGGTMAFSGLIATDGTFHLAVPSLDSTQVMIDGRVPAKGSAGWTGTYTITSTACSGSQTGSFTATIFQPINGIFAGQIGGIALGSGTSMSMQVSEGIPVVFQHANGTTSTYYPLSATISINGSPCFKHGTTTGNAFPNEVMGDFIILDFTMDDGSQMHMDAWMTDTSETTLNPVSLIVSGGQCSNKASTAVLTAQ